MTIPSLPQDVRYGVRTRLRFVSVARYTSPMPPAPIGATMS